jgi:hypothetical protein
VRQLQIIIGGTEEHRFSGRNKQVAVQGVQRHLLKQPDHTLSDTELDCGDECYTIVSRAFNPNDYDWDDVSSWGIYTTRDGEKNGKLRQYSCRTSAFTDFMKLIAKEGEHWTE